MCLNYRLIKQAAFKVSLKNETKSGFIIVYKNLIYDSMSPYQGFYYKYGWNQSSRKSTRLSKFEKTMEAVFEGFHVFLDKNEAITSSLEPFYTLSSHRKKTCAFKAKLKDLVAIGTFDEYQSAVFTKLYLPRPKKKIVKKKVTTKKKTKH